MKKRTFLALFTSLLLISACGPSRVASSNSENSTQSSTSEVSSSSKEESTSSSEISSSEQSSSELSSSSETSSSSSSEESSSSSEVPSSSEESSSESKDSSSTSSSDSSGPVSSDEPSSSSESSSPASSGSSSEEIEPIHLEIPEVILDEETGIASWEAVDNALAYNVIINAGNITQTTNLSYPLDDYSNISVQAVNGEFTSLWSDAVTNFTTVETVYCDDGDIRVFFHDANITTQVLKPGETVKKPNNPAKTHYIFDGFYEDPYFTTLFDFDEKVFEDTIIYTKWIKQDYINTEFWVKADPKITSSIMSINSSESGWKFIPLTRSVESNKVYYKAIVEVTGASTSNPAGFLVMDGFEDGGLRNYYKSGIYEEDKELDFLIKEDGTYIITFSLDNLYGSSSNPCHAKFEKYTANSINYSHDFELATPVITIDENTNTASWLEVAGAISYDVIIDNKEIINTQELAINLAKGSHISVRAVAIGVSSKWSIPQGNIETIYTVAPEVKDDEVSYYFVGSNTPAKVVKENTTIESAPTLTKVGYDFEGWYTNVARTTKATFPFKLTRNTIFYPKFVNKALTTTEADFKLVNANGDLIANLTLNIDNYEFIEYESEVFSVTTKTNLYVVSSYDETNKYGPYEVETGKYVMYFSEEKLWDIDTENERNIYLQVQDTTYYFSNNHHWSKVYSYSWGKDVLKSWPGSEMTYVTTNEYNEKIFKVTVDIEIYPNIIFNNGSGEQTKDIDLTKYPSGTGFYLTGNNHYDVGTYQYK